MIVQTAVPYATRRFQTEVEFTVHRGGIDLVTEWLIGLLR